MPSCAYFVKLDVATIVKSFLCPSDQFRIVKPDMGPSNYVACSGSNANGDGLAGDGIFHGVDLDVVRNAGVRITAVTDGTSNTVAFSETTLGAGGTAPAGAMDVRLYYKNANPLTQANCDASTQTPVLNVADFTCFLQRYAAGDTYANCDNSTTIPVLNVADFTCFLQQFAAGCP